MGDEQIWLAAVFIASFFVLMVISLMDYFLNGNLTVAEFIGSLFSGWLGTILGFYFGQKPVKGLRDMLAEERTRSMELMKYIQTGKHPKEEL